MRRAVGLLVGLLALAALACNYNAPTSTPMPRAVTVPAVPLATVTTPAEPTTAPAPTEVPTEVPTEEPTQEPTEEPTATAEPTAEPQAQLAKGAAVFDDDGNLVYLEPPGPAGGGALLRPLTSSGQDEPAALSPDGRQVLFFRIDENWESELWVVNTDGSGETLLVGRDQLPPRQETDAAGATVTVGRNPYSTAWLPDARTIAFNTSWNYEYGLALVNDLWLVDTETLALTELFAPGLGGEFAFSPDGSWVLLTTPGGSRDDGGQMDGRIDLVRADGSSRQTLITFPPISTASEYQFYPLPRWLADGTAARVLVPSPAPWDPGAYGTLWVIAVDGPSAAELARLPGNFLFQPDPWSPDFNRLAYVAQLGDPGSNEHELYLADGSGRDAVLYDTGEPVEFAGWSPTGDRFLYFKGSARALQLGEAGQTPKPLFPDGDGGILDPHWLDGDRFLYLASQDGGWDLMMGTVKGTELWLASPDGDFPSLVVAEKGSP